ncbi:MAG: HNH endonuclease [Planctomycetia bacterium]|nr:HNH endonuclease [Planctomycetia bacterium]
MAAFTYPAQPHERRHGPQGYASYTSYRPWLRDEFSFRCVYCLLREPWARHGSLDIDHFLAVAHNPGKVNDYDNLLYACTTCNSAKGDRLMPDPTSVLTSGAVHVAEDGSIHAANPEAARLIELLGLDSAPATEFRMLWKRRCQRPAGTVT